MLNWNFNLSWYIYHENEPPPPPPPCRIAVILMQCTHSNYVFKFPVFSLSDH